MIRLQVKQQNSNELIDLDVFGTENINLTLQVDDVRSFATKNASYSKEFQLPATKTNNAFFKQYYNLDNFTGTYNPYKVAKALLYVNDVLIIEGFLMLTKALEKTTERSYSVVIFNDVANILDVLADATLKDLDYTDIQHSFLVANIANSWTATGVTLADGVTTTDNVFYPIINDGYIASNEAMLDLGYATFNHRDQYVMNVKLKYIIDKIFDFAGFSYDSDFFNTNYFKSIYFDTGISKGANDVEPTNQIICTGIDNSLPQAIDFYNGPNINYTTEEGDTLNQFNHDTSVFTAGYDGTTHFSLTLDIAGSATVVNGQIILPNGTLYLAGVYTPSGGVAEIIDIGSAYNYVVTSNTITMSGSFSMSTNDTLALFVYTDIASGVFSIPAGADATLTITQMPQYPTENMITQDLGDITLSDILKDILNSFNLTVESIGNSAFKIEPYSSYITNTIHDWTDKIDFNEHSVEPIDIPKRIEYKFAEDEENYVKQRYNNYVATEFGNHIVEFDVDSDEVITIQNSVFASPITEVLAFNNLPVQSIKTKEGEDTYIGYNNKPRLVFKRTGDTSPFGAIAEASIFNPNFAAYEVITTNTLNAHAFDKKLSEVTNDDNSLLYGLINTTSLQGINTQPINTLFNTYWLPYIRERYNIDNGVIVKFKINLTSRDLDKFSFGDKVRIENQLFRVNKIEFNTEKQLLSKIELIRI